MRITVKTALAFGLVLAASAMACSDESDAVDGPGGTDDPSNGGTQTPGTTNPDGSTTPAEPPVYAVASAVQAPQPTTYVIVSPTSPASSRRRMLRSRSRAAPSSRARPAASASTSAPPRTAR